MTGQGIWALARECGALRSGSFDLVKEWSFTEVGLSTFADRLLTQGYAEGRKDEREACALECAAIADGFQRTGEGNKDGRYDWMVAGAQECADALRETPHNAAESA